MICNPPFCKHLTVSYLSFKHDSVYTGTLDARLHILLASTLPACSRHTAIAVRRPVQAELRRPSPANVRQQERGRCGRVRRRGCSRGTGRATSSHRGRRNARLAKKSSAAASIPAAFRHRRAPNYGGVAADAVRANRSGVVTRVHRQRATGASERAGCCPCRSALSYDGRHRGHGSRVVPPARPRTVRLATALASVVASPMAPPLRQDVGAAADPAAESISGAVGRQFRGIAAGPQCTGPRGVSALATRTGYRSRSTL
jgi:hypothetical protein